MKNSSLNMSSADFRRAGHKLIDEIADFLDQLPQKKVTQGITPAEARALLTTDSLPKDGQDSETILKQATQLLFGHSLFNGHPRFWGYITSSAAPIGALADLLASSVNANVGAFALSPVATEIERQTVKWLAQLIGYPETCGGLFVSGGNMANFVGFLAARRNKIEGDIRSKGLSLKDGNHTFTIYCAKGTHTWVQKAADLFGFGTDSIRWIPLNTDQQMDLDCLEEQIGKDIQEGNLPFIVIGNAGTVSTGVVDSLDEMSTICKANNLWLHIDGAYGAPAAALPENATLFQGLHEADSIAIDPHKWLYSPLEAGCVLVKENRSLHETFSYIPEYYNFEGDDAERPVNFHEYGMQNSRGFRALKVWLSLKQVGKTGIVEMIRKDIHLAEFLFTRIEQIPELEAVSHHLSITAFRFVPSNPANSQDNSYVNALNEKLLNRLQSGGEVFLSNALIDDKYCLRVCIVNFRTTESDLEALTEIVVREGRLLHKELTSQPHDV